MEYSNLAFQIIDSSARCAAGSQHRHCCRNDRQSQERHRATSIVSSRAKSRDGFTGDARSVQLRGDAVVCPGNPGLVVRIGTADGIT